MGGGRKRRPPPILHRPRSKFQSMAPPPAAPTLAAPRISSAAAVAMRAAIRLAGGREVVFRCTLDDAGTVQTARVVSRGDARSVLALPGFANRGEIVGHNNASGRLSASH